VCGKEGSEDRTLGGYIRHHPSRSSEHGGSFSFLKVHSVMRGASFCETSRFLSTSRNGVRCLGYKDVVMSPLATILEQDQVYFPDGCLRLKVDLWFPEKDPCDDKDEV